MKVLFMYMHFNYIYWLGVIFIRVVPGIANNTNNKIKCNYIVLNPWEKIKRTEEKIKYHDFASYKWHCP